MAKSFIGWRSGLAAPVLANPGTRYAALNQTITPFTVVNSSGTGTFSATGLPTGLSINASTGEISGTVDAGVSVTTHSVDIDCTNATGTSSVTFTYDIRSAYTEIDSLDTFPYVMSTASRLYVLTEDITVDAGAFIFNASGCVLDLNGYTVTFANAAPLSVPNGGFESGTGTTVPNWDLSGAPDAAIAANDIYAWGEQILSFDNITSANVIVSDEIAIPTAGIEYAATVTPMGPQTSVVTLQVIDSATETVLATSAASSNNHRGFSVICYYTPTTTDPIKLKITVAPAAGQTQTVDIDYVSFTHSRIYGVMATNYRSDWPQYIKDNTTYWNNVSACRNPTITGGSIVQGQSLSYWSNPIYARAVLQGMTVTRCNMSVNGIDSTIVEGTYADGTVTITDNVCTSTADKVTNRFSQGTMFLFAQTTGAIKFLRNSLSGCPKSGIEISGSSNHEINDNTIDANAIVTTCYGVVASGISDTTINGNRIVTTRSGRGIFLGSGDGSPADINGVEVANNYIDIRERANMEFGENGIEATALRMRTYVDRVDSNISVHGNTFIARTYGSGYARGAIAIRTSHANELEVDDWNCHFYANTFKAIVYTTNTNWFARAVTFEGVNPLVRHEFTGNILESNDVCLGFGGNDGFNAYDIVLIDNQLVKSSEGEVRAGFQEVRIGQGGGVISGIEMYSMSYAGGATNTLTLTGTGNIDVSTGFRVTVTVTDGSNPISGATVSVKDGDLVEVYSATTAANGIVSDIPVVTSILTRIGAGTPTTDDRNDITVDVTATGYNAGQDVLTLTADDATTISLTAV